jgi:hypothetical protein
LLVLREELSEIVECMLNSTEPKLNTKINKVGLAANALADLAAAAATSLVSSS